MQRNSFLWTTLKLALLGGAAVSIAGCDAAGCALALACGGSGDSAVPVALPVFPKDFAYPYFAFTSNDSDLYLVPATALDQPALVTKPVPGYVSSFSAMDSGEWSAGNVTDPRPAQLVYIQANQAWRVNLRGGTSVTPVAFGSDPSVSCFLYRSFVDYATPLNSWILYAAAAPGNTCYDGSPQEFHAQRLGASTSTPAQTAKLFEAFYSSTGAITGFVAQSGSNLVYLDAQLANSQTIASNVTGIRTAAFFSRTTDTQYYSFVDSVGTAHIERIASNGSHSSFATFSSTTLRYGFSDATALYVVAQPGSGNPQIVRVPYDGSARSTLMTEPANSVVPFIWGITDHAVIFSEPANPGAVLKSVGKISGGAVKTLATASNDFYSFYSGNGGPDVLSDRVVWTAYDGDDGTGQPLSSRAGITRDDGTVVESHNNSEWLGYFYNFDTRSQPGLLPPRYEVLVHDYTGSTLGVTGDQGGIVALYDFLAGTKQDNLLTIPDTVSIGPLFYPVGMGDYYHLDTGISDVFSYDFLSGNINLFDNPNQDFETTAFPF